MGRAFPNRSVRARLRRDQASNRLEAQAVTRSKVERQTRARIVQADPTLSAHEVEARVARIMASWREVRV